MSAHIRLSGSMLSSEVLSVERSPAMVDAAMAHAGDGMTGVP